MKLVLVSLVATIGAVAFGAVPASAQQIGFPPTIPACGSVGALAPGDWMPAQVDVVRAKGVECSTARRVARRCIREQNVGDWRASAVNYTMSLRRPGQRVSFRISQGPVPECVRDRGLGHVREDGKFGPYEEPNSYPDRWPPPFGIAYQWASPVTTDSATLPFRSISTVQINGLVRNPTGAIAAVWFEYGKTRALDTSSIKTEAQTPPIGAGEAPVPFTARLTHLSAKTRYWWRAAAAIDPPAGGPATTVYGTIGSFVTKPYPTIKDPLRPCLSAPDQGADELFQITESLALACPLRTYNFTKGACFVACNSFFHGTLSCDKDYPRNLNAGSWSITIPKIGYAVSVDDLVNYWRSNNSNRFIELPTYNKNSAGADVGPIPGWHDWDVAQWAYPLTDTSTFVDFWINCTQQWGNVIDASALAAGEGNDVPNLTPPAAPQNVELTKTSDGGVDVTWDPPDGAGPATVAGYFLAPVIWDPDEPKKFPDNWTTPITTTATKGHINIGQLNVIRRSAGPGDLSVNVGAVSPEGSISLPATVVFRP